VRKENGLASGRRATVKNQKSQVLFSGKAKNVCCRDFLTENYQQKMLQSGHHDERNLGRRL